MKKWLCILLLVMLGVGGCSDPPGRALKVATNQWLGYEPLYLARYRNSFKTQIDIVQFPSSSDVMRAFRNGNLDAAALTLDEVMLLASQGEDLVVLMALDFSNGADVVLGWPPVTQLKDIKGKQVGVENTALGAMMLSAALDHAGLAASDVSIRNLPEDEQYQAFLQHQVDVLVTFEPLSTRLRNKGAVVLFDSSIVPDMIVDVLVAKHEALDHHRKQLQDLVRGYYEARDDMFAHQNETYSFMGRRLKLSRDQLIQAFRGLRLPSLNDNIRWMSGNPSAFDSNVKTLYRVMLSHKLLLPMQQVRIRAQPAFLEALSQ